MNNFLEVVKEETSVFSNEKDDLKAVFEKLTDGIFLPIETTCTSDNESEPSYLLNDFAEPSFESILPSKHLLEQECEEEIVKNIENIIEEYQPLDKEAISRQSQPKTEENHFEELLVSENPLVDFSGDQVENSKDISLGPEQNKNELTDEMELLRRSSFHIDVGPKIQNHEIESGDNYIPPIFSRAPPDGHEFPPNYCEPQSLPPLVPEKSVVMPAESSETKCPVGRSYSLSSKTEYCAKPFRDNRADTNGYHSNNKIDDSVMRHNQRNNMGSLTTPHNSSNRWNSEESLAAKTSGRIFSRRESEKPTSVRDRIALFSKPEQAQPQPPQVVATYSNVAATSKADIEENVKANNRNGFNEKEINNGYNGFAAAVPVSTTDCKVINESVKTTPFNENNKAISVGEKFKENTTSKRENIPGYTSNYPQTQLTNHLRYSYAGQKSFDEYKRSGINAGYTSVLDGRRHNSTKLKGLVIPGKPSLLSSSGNPLPTIVNSKQLLSPRGHPGLAQTTNSHWQKSELNSEPKSLGSLTENVSKSNGVILLSEPPWKAMPSYETQTLSKTFKSRPLELPKNGSNGTNTSNLTYSVSTTPPSSLTSPLSPPPSSPSSVCSSNTSSSCGISKQSTFQFSLSHSKPVTPTLPEKPILVSPTPSYSNIEQPENVLVYSEKTFFVNQPLLPETMPPPLPSSEPPIPYIEPKLAKTPLKIKNQVNADLKSIDAPKPQITKMSALDRLDSLVSFSYPVKVSSETSTDLLVPQRLSEQSTSPRQQKTLDKNHNSYNENQLTCDEISLSLVNNCSENGRTSSTSSVLSTTENRVWSSRPASESDDDTNSVISLRTEDSRQTADDSLSDATTDSLDRSNNDPEFRPRRLSQQRTVLRARVDSTDSVKNFRALAERWELRAGDVPEPVSRSNSNGPLAGNSTSLVRRDSGRSTSSSATEGSVKLPPSLMPRCSDQSEKDKGGPLSLPTTNRLTNVSSKYKYSDSTDSLQSERSKISSLSSLERSVSSFALDTVGGESRDRVSTRNRSSTIGPIGKSNRSSSVSDIRKTFETQNGFTSAEMKIHSAISPAENSTVTATPIQKQEAKQPISYSQPIKDHRSSSTLICPTEVHHRRFSSIDSTASDSGVSTPAHYGSSSSLAAPSSNNRDFFGSVTSLASTSSLISAQELQQLIDEANQSLSEEHVNMAVHEITVVVLHKDTLSGGIGITLAGGVDYEVKEISVHKVITSSLADRDGRLRKGDRIISINGRNLKGVTHKEALDVLKSPRQEVVLVTSRERVLSTPSNESVRHHSSSVSHTTTGKTDRAMLLPVNLQTKAATCVSSTEKIDSDNVTAVLATEPKVKKSRAGSCVTLELIKDGTGLGFSLEGGKDSPLGDKPLIVKRVFKGGIADREGNLEIGDEILSVNQQLVTIMTRTEAWNFMKKLPDGPVTIVVKKA